MGFLHPEQELLDAARRREGPARQRQGRRALHDARSRACSPPATRAAGQSLIVWAINEGRQCARMVDRYLARSRNGDGRQRLATIRVCAGHADADAGDPQGSRR